jgi:hypothetical protein
MVRGGKANWSGGYSDGWWAMAVGGVREEGKIGWKFWERKRFWKFWGNRVFYAGQLVFGFFF